MPPDATDRPAAERGASAAAVAAAAEDRALQHAALERAVAIGLSPLAEAERALRALVGMAGRPPTARTLAEALAGAGVPPERIQAIDPYHLAGRVVGGFRLVRPIGLGGVGTVYLAVQQSLGREVAVKLLDPRLAGVDEARERFRREALAAGRLRHPHIVQAIDYGEDGGLFYLAEEYLPGGSLAERLERGPLAEREALAVARDTARALAFAAAEGFVHRDVKPGNLLLDAGGVVKLADLGFALDTRAAAEDRLTLRGRTVGSPEYLAPEQALGASDIDARADVYGLGVTLFEMLTGARPFEGDTPTQVMRMQVSAPLPELGRLGPAVSAATRALIARMCAKERSQRLDGPAAVLEEVEAILAAIDRPAAGASAAAAEPEAPASVPAGPTVPAAAVPAAAPARPQPQPKAMPQPQPQPPKPPASVAATSAAVDEPKLRRLGPYELVEELGRGGMGVVYRARDVRLLRDVALKELHPELRPAPEERDRFLEEARTAAQLQHPGMVPVHDAGLDAEDRLAYFTMELVRGRTLAETLRALAKGDAEVARGFSRYQRLQVFLEVARTVSYAHAKGVIHRDLKPANIMLGRFGEVRVMDWGLAKVIAPGGAAAPTAAAVPAPPAGAPRFDTTAIDAPWALRSAAVTMPGVVSGTPGYMAPEQAAGLGSLVGPTTDVYALGATLYHLLALRPPFAGRPTEELLRAVQHEAPVRPRALDPTIPLALEAICLRALERDPGRRYPSAAELADDVQRFLEGLPVEAYPEGVLARLATRGRRHPRALGAAALALVLGLAGALGALVRIDRERRRADAEREDAVKAWKTALSERDRADELQHVRDRDSADLFHAMGRRALGANDPFAALVLFRRALGLADRGDIRAGLLQARLASPRRVARVRLPGGARLVDVDPEGQRLAVATDDGATYVLDARTLSVLRALGPPGAAVHAVRFDPAGALVVAAAADGHAAVWDAATGAPRREVAAHEGPCRDAWIGSAAGRLYTAGDDGRIRAFDLASGAPVWERTAGEGGVFGLALAPDGARLASAGEDGAIRIFAAATGEPEGAWRREAAGWLYAVAWSADGRRVAAAGDEGRVGVWEPFGELRTEMWSRNESLHAIQFLAGGRSLVAAGAEVRVLDIDRGLPRLALSRGAAPRHVGITVWPGGERLAVAGFDGALDVFDLVEHPVARTLAAHTGQVVSVSTTADLALVASGGWDGVAWLWDGRTGRALRACRGHRGRISSVALAPDGRRLATGGQDRTVRWWDTATGAEVRCLEGHREPVKDVGWTPDGDTFASLDGGGRLRTWSARDGASRAEVEAHQGVALALDISPDGRRIATAGTDARARVFALDRGLALELELVGHEQAVEGIAFSGDGSRLATGSWDGTARIWDARTGALLRTLTGHRGWVYGVRFDPSGRFLASASADGTVRLWELATGATWLEVPAHDGEAIELDFAKSEGSLVTCGFDRVVRVFSMDGLRRYVEAPASELLAEDDGAVEEGSR